MHRLLVSLVVLAAAAACGGSTEPLIPADVGAAFAEDADAIVAALEAGDSCTALDRVDALRSDVAGTDGVAPAGEQELIGALDQLADQIQCDRGDEQPTEPVEDDPGQDKDEKDEKDEKEEKDEEEKEDEEKKNKDEEEDGEEGGGRGNGTKGRDT